MQNSTPFELRAAAYDPFHTENQATADVTHIYEATTVQVISSWIGRAGVDR